MEHDRSKALLRELQRVSGTGNDRCADCGRPEKGSEEPLHSPHRQVTGSQLQLEEGDKELLHSVIREKWRVVQTKEMVSPKHRCTCRGHSGDAAATGPEWASYKLGILVCMSCSGIHRNLPGITRVKSLVLDFWENDLIEFMKNHGNLCAKAKYEAKVPPYYYIPHYDDCSVLREQWIRAKYEREEFVATRVCQDPCPAENREGFLWKLGQGRRQFHKRKFSLSPREGVMKYYGGKECTGPKAVISMETLNAMFQEIKIGHSHGLQITYSTDGQTRNLFVYHENGKEIVDWFNAIRAARYHYLRTAFPKAPEHELIPRITRNFVKEGYMEKTGPKHKEAFKGRWFSLDSQERNLMYFKNPLDELARGQIFLGRKDEGYEVRPELPEGIRMKKRKPGIILVTPGREFVFLCDNDERQKEWIEALDRVISQH